MITSSVSGKGWTAPCTFALVYRLAAVLGDRGALPLAASGAAVAAHSPGRIFKGTKSVLTAAQVERLAAHATHRSIIIFKNQLTSLPAKGATAPLRMKAANAAQAGVLSELRQLHATHVRGFQIINAISATISTAEITRLRAQPGDPGGRSRYHAALRPAGRRAGPASPRRRQPAAPARAQLTSRRSRSARATRPSR